MNIFLKSYFRKLLKNKAHNITYPITVNQQHKTLRVLRMWHYTSQEVYIYKLLLSLA